MPQRQLFLTMARVIGQLDSLSSVKQKLSQQGITDFRSIGDLHSFLSNFNNQKQRILKDTETEFLSKFNALKREQDALSNIYRTESSLFREIHDTQLSILQKKHDRLKDQMAKGFIYQLLYWIPLNRTNANINNLESNYEQALKSKLSPYKLKMKEIRDEILSYTFNKQEVIQGIARPKIAELQFKKSVINGLNPYILGAIGENKVMNELKCLPDNYILINNYQLRFTKPLYNRQEDDYIYSIQIDHVLISPAGVFIIETKNWSKKSIDTLSLRSPVKQIRRVNYALFRILNSAVDNYEIKLSEHHWGKKEIPIRNLVVMINQKPEQDFRFVKVLTLKEVNHYVKHFKPVLNDLEIKNIYNFMMSQMKYGVH